MFNQNIQNFIQKLKNNQQILKGANRFLFYTTAILAVVTVWMTVSFYVDLSESNERLIVALKKQLSLTRMFSQKYNEVSGQLTRVAGENEKNKKALAEVMAELKSTKDLLASAQASRAKLREYVRALKAVNEKQLTELKGQFEGAIQLLQEENANLDSEMAQLRGQLEFLSGSVKNAQEAKTFLTLNRTNLELVHRKMEGFRREALRETDRIKSLLGNKGYFLKDGALVHVERAKYESASQIAAAEPGPVVADKKKLPKDKKKKPKITVTIVE